MILLYDDTTLKNIIKKYVDNDTFSLIFAELEGAQVNESVPFWFIDEYSRTHDPVCAGNLDNLKRAYLRSRHGATI